MTPPAHKPPSPRPVAGQKGTSERSHASLRLPVAALLALACAALGFYAGRTTRNEPSPEVASTDAADKRSAPRGERATSPKAPAAPRRSLERAFVTRPAELFVATDARAETRYRQAQSKELLNLVRNQIGLALRLDPDAHQEATANRSTLYLEGWLDAVARLAPDMLDELATEIESIQCGENTKPAELIAVSRILMSIPELANERGFECVFSKHTAEDSALWHTLDAWRGTGMPRPSALAAIERNAKDSRTLDRLAETLRDPSAEPYAQDQVAQPLSAPMAPNHP